MDAAICISLRSRAIDACPFCARFAPEMALSIILGDVRDRHGSFLVGYVVMPEHIDLRIGEPVKRTPSTVIQVLKQRVSRRLCRKRRAPAGQLHLIFASGDNSLPRFWQRRFYDFTGTGSTCLP